MIDFIINFMSGMAVAIVTPILFPSSRPALMILDAQEWVSSKYDLLKFWK